MRSKIIIILAILVVILGAAFLWQTVSLVQVKRNYSNLLSATDDHQIENKQYLKNLERIKSIIAKKAASPTQIIEQSMDFVHDNSLHVIDKERNKYLYETSLDKFLQEGIQAVSYTHLTLPTN